MGDSDEVQIEPALAATDEVRSLVGELEAVLSAEYSPEQRHGLTLDAIFQPHVRFFLARLRGAAVGCGGVYLFPDFAEVKRMYVRHTARGQGVADAILARIEAEVRRAGISMLRLETGDRQIAAMRLYVRMGFRSSASAPSPDDAQSIASSVFFEKRITHSRCAHAGYGFDAAYPASCSPFCQVEGRVPKPRLARVPSQ